MGLQRVAQTADLVEHVMHLPAACAYMARGITMAGVSWVRGDPDQGRQLRGFDFAQLRHVVEQRGRKDWADALDLLQALNFATQIWIVV